MILVRNVFHTKIGQTAAVVALWKEALAVAQQVEGGPANARLLTDLAGGSFYTVVLEHTFESLAHLEQGMKTVMSNKQWRAVYEKIIPLLEGGHREMFNVVS
ncbi:MAG: hypothetical protein IT445_03885 [Phycisphaeraceae bacterium]|nr:hypothetical protein [Phycisphaeraceae bacterium]